MLFPQDMLDQATAFLAGLRARGAKVVTAESCTGGLIAGLLTEIAGSSDVVERGYITYSNNAKTEALGVAATLIRTHGAVSEPVVRAMAQGALHVASAQLALAVSGVAGPGGGTTEKPVGRVHIAAATPTAILHLRMDYGALSRSEIRLQTVRDALALGLNAISV